MKIEIICDSIYVKTFKTNKDSFDIVFSTGRHELEKIAELLKLEGGKNYKLTIEEF